MDEPGSNGRMYGIVPSTPVRRDKDVFEMACRSSEPNRAWVYLQIQQSFTMNGFVC